MDLSLSAVSRVENAPRAAARARSTRGFGYSGHVFSVFPRTSTLGYVLIEANTLILPRFNRAFQSSANSCRGRALFIEPMDGADSSFAARRHNEGDSQPACIFQ